MHITISSDEYKPIIDTLIEKVKEFGHQVTYFGPLADEAEKDWTEVTMQAIDEIKSKLADEAIILCWTGTGCALIANKVRGIRAALCHDAETAKGARIWNHANVLALSLRLLKDNQLDAILDAWFNTPFSNDSWNLKQIANLNEVEARLS